jgi:molybdopterin converting factor small subunit
MGELAKYGGLRTVQLELEDRVDLSGLLAALDQHTTKPLVPVIVLPGGLISSHYSIMCNGSNVLLAKGLSTSLADGDEVTVVPKVAGGSERRPLR